MRSSTLFLSSVSLCVLVSGVGSLLFCAPLFFRLGWIVSYFFFCPFYHSMCACVSIRAFFVLLVCYVVLCATAVFTRRVTSSSFFFAAFDSVCVFVFSFVCGSVCYVTARVSLSLLVSVCVCHLALLFFFSSAAILVLFPPLVGHHLSLFGG